MDTHAFPTESTVAGRPLVRFGSVAGHTAMHTVELFVSSAEGYGHDVVDGMVPSGQLNRAVVTH